jgi:hypothetical protein
MPSATKEIQIGTNRYQLGRLSARQGSWVASQFRDYILGRLLNPDKKLDERELALMLTEVFSSLPEEIYNNIQAKCLNVCKRYDKVGETEIPSPVIRADGTWNGVGEPGLPELLSLFAACLSFNLYSFFEPGARETLLVAFPDAAPAKTV